MKISYELLKWDAVNVPGKIIVRVKATALEGDGTVIRHGDKNSPPVEHEVERAVPFLPEEGQSPQNFALGVAKSFKPQLDAEVKRLLLVLGKEKVEPKEVGGSVKIDL